MITNQRQYRITRNWLSRFEEARAAAELRDSDLHPRARQALLDQHASQIDELRAQLVEYETLRRGDVRVIDLESLSDLPDALIRARTAVGLSQAALAGRLGLKKQQVQRWEATRYAGVSLDRLQEIADALGIRISERVVLPVAGAKRPRGTSSAAS